MFAKVFEQIFDSSIAQDYTIRHMFIDLLILADQTGAVDMTPDAIARRTNVPQETVERCISELCQPDVKSRSPLEDGKRLVPLDSHRDWGWRIVNYQHYRKIRDQEARRSYFRDYQRKRRRKERAVKDTEVNKVNRVETSASPSSSKSRCTQTEAEEFCKSIGLPRSDGLAMWLHWEEKGWGKVKDWRLTIRKWKSFGYLPSQKQKKNGASPDDPKPDKSKVEVPERFKAWIGDRYPDKRAEAMKWQTWADVPRNGLRDEWWKEEKAKLPVEA